MKNKSKNRIKTRTRNNNEVKQPLKVVYISNPMKVTTSASDFRALVQRLTGKGAVWPIDLEFGDNQTAPNNHISNNVSIISDDSNDVKDCGVESSATNPSPDTSTASEPLDHDQDQDGVMFLDHDFSVFNYDHDFEFMIQSDGGDLFKY